MATPDFNPTETALAIAMQALRDAWMGTFTGDNHVLLEGTPPSFLVKARRQIVKLHNELHERGGFVSDPLPTER